MKRCLYCYQNLEDSDTDFHSTCSNKMFDQSTPPDMEFGEDDLRDLALQIVQHGTTVTGVQAKISLHVTKKPSEKAKRFTVVGLWGDYILKPATDLYPELPEVEDLTMHLAQLASIQTVPHCLIRLRSGSLAYITKRVDRNKKTKLAMEDMCQLSERLTEDKYRGSYEQIGKLILTYSSMPGLDLVNYFEILLFSFLTGNADMHLKNFSLLERPGVGMALSPAYDLLNTTLVNPADKEELALTLNGKKSKFKKRDFIQAMETLQIDARQQANIFNKMEKSKDIWLKQIEASFLSDDFKAQYQAILMERFNRLFA
ncbi:MAG: HipA domain-containing protein [Chitinophagaceae bacterium]|nr:HipA domain-containing protein [Chitinophagaceae bacterium]